MICRHAESAVSDALSDTPVVLIHGPRQCGKSTLAQSLAVRSEPMRYVTLDDLESLDLAQRDPVAFLSAFGWPLVIDEIQRAPQLMLAIKASVDRDRVPGKYLLTGSANVLALPKIADSLAGRMAIVDLLPFSQAEMAARQSSFVELALNGNLPTSGSLPLENLEEALVKGGFPEPSLRASHHRRDAWFHDYVKTLIERDVRELANIEALADIPRVLRLIAARAGSTLNVVSLSRDTGIPNTSLHRYLDLLRAIFLVQYVPAWSNDRGARLTKSPKAYLVDTGLLCYLENLSAKTLLEDRTKIGPILENFVAMELRKLCALLPSRPEVHHLRTVRQLEVDFVLEARGGALVGIDVKAADTLHADDSAGLRFLRELATESFRAGIVLYTGTEVKPLDRDIFAMPISALWTL